MKLGDYTFEWVPDECDLPLAERRTAVRKTYTSAVFFSWGVVLAGSRVTMRWEWMPAEQFLALRALYKADTGTVWYPQQEEKLWLSLVEHGPFLVGEEIEDQTTGAKADVLSVHGTVDGHTYIKLTDRSGSFAAGSTIEKTSGSPTKSARVDGVDVLPNYNVEILRADGSMFETVGTNFLYRRNVIVDLLILSEAT